MAFSFLDLFPSTPSAVAGSQGARDILENQYKQAINYADMNKALLQNVQAQHSLDLQQQQEPIQQALTAIKTLQDLNLVGGEHFKGIDLNDPEALKQAIQGAADSGQLKTNLEGDLMKSQAAASASAARTQTVEAGKDARAEDAQRAERDKQLRNKAFDRLDELNKRYPKSPTGEMKARALVSDYQSLLAYGVDEVSRVFWNKHSALLAAAGFQAPGAPQKPQRTAPQPAAPASPAPGAQPSAAQQPAPGGFNVLQTIADGLRAGPPKPALAQTETINGVTYQLVNGKYVRVK